MKKNLTLAAAFLLYCCISNCALTQNAKPWQADLALGAGSSTYTIAPSLTRWWALGSHWQLGVGARATYTGGSNLRYETVPAILTTGQVGPQVLFLPNKAENLDTLTLANTNSLAVNLNVYALYTFAKKWGVGFNIDVVGFTVGGASDATYRSRGVTQPGSVSAIPTPLNLLLVSDNDIGSINSELYVKYNWSESWAVRAGVSYNFTEYTTTQKLRDGNDRFRNKSLLGMLAVSYRF